MPDGGGMDSRSDGGAPGGGGGAVTGERSIALKSSIHSSSDRRAGDFPFFDVPTPGSSPSCEDSASCD